MAVARRVQAVRRALPRGEMLPSRVLAAIVSGTYRAERLWHRLTGGGA